MLEATTPARPHHAVALELLDRWPTRGVPLYLSGQIIREYLVVATRPASVNGLGLSLEQVVDNVTRLRNRIGLLDEKRAVADRLQSLLSRTPVTGIPVHDANVVATMLVHGVPTLLTANVQHFERFRGHIELLELAHVAPT